jgi:DNA polymerase III epsilon subunit-like protein
VKEKTMMTTPITMIDLEIMLHQQERTGPVTSLDDLRTRLAQRKAIEDHLEVLATTIHTVRKRLSALPKLPGVHEVGWAQAVLALPNLAFLEVDTDGLGEGANVLRVLLLTMTELVIFDTFVKPPRLPSEKLLSITGITREQLERAPTFEQAWPSIVAALRGRYLVSYNLSFDESMLRSQAMLHHTEMPALIASCLMVHSTSYFQETQHAKLSALCARLGYPLPEPPMQDAQARALGQLHLVQAMSNAITGVVTTAALSDEEADAHPF